MNAARASSARPAVKRPAPATTLPTWQRVLVARREGLPEWAARVGVARVIASCIGLFVLGLVVGAAGAFATGTPDGLRSWLKHYAAAVAVACEELTAVADGVTDQAPPRPPRLTGGTSS